jgi:hypothetical protein
MEVLQMKLNWIFSALLALSLILSACAQVEVPPATPAETQEPAAPPPTTAYPDPDQPVVGPGDGSQEPDTAYAPQPGDDQLDRASVFVEEFGILTLESFPPQFVLHLTGNLPTPCHELRAVVSEPDQAGNINVELYSLSDPDTICIQVLAPFEANIALGSYSDGSYPVMINGEQLVGEIKP